ncbi:class I SAM-dependent methyltransferase [Desulfobacula phenolica]|uniref:Methyltransferase domain-containing protein n=1 Tax=Desulfobacula phenolica TaxID=90732 RepID=A0A1H2JPK2_9BACT|nr:class I SAM-dependent methyltransferase [Desulfobacula phenolica]SDU58419.1 Methyltransferase domain-containing protein [Desulfobacula phenolica]
MKPKSMHLIEKATLIHFHRHRQERFATGSAGALGWKHVNSQQKRFEVLASIGNLDDCEILDPGCGYGDLLTFLDARFKGVTYRGIDLLPEFVKTAAKSFACRANTCFMIGDFSRMELPKTDYVLASGAFGYKTEDKHYSFRTIDRLFKTARKGIGFNMLDKNKFPDHPLLTGHDKNVVVDFCQTLSSATKVVEDYLEDDFTVFVHKKNRTKAFYR